MVFLKSLDIIHKESVKHKAFYLLVFLLILSIVLLFIENQDRFLSSDYWQRYPSLKTLYYDSQYANPNFTVVITDENADSFAGGALITGTNPVLVLADTPPLGKYLIGLSALLFNNENIFVLLSGIGSLIMLYLIGMQIFNSRILAIISPLILSFEPIFRNQFRYVPLFDLFQLFFLLLSFYFFNKGVIKFKRVLIKRILFYFALANIFLGCFISIKFFVTGITIVAADYSVLFFNRFQKRLVAFTATLPLAVIVLFLSYSRILAFGYSLRSFFGIQKYVYLYHKSQLILPLSVWPLILFNKWYVWFGPQSVISDPQWIITWPIITILSILTTIFYLFGKIQKNREVEILMAWSVFYLLFLSIGQISSRYLIILLPILYVVSLYGIIKTMPSGLILLRHIIHKFSGGVR